jgi:hypothetical protein
LVGGYLLNDVYRDRDKFKKKLTHVRVKRPCATCNGKGYIRPSSPAAIAAAGGEENLPRFPCSQCGHTETPGVIVEEYKRGEVPEMDEQGRTIDDLTRK